jgi:hypothetical protein
MIRHAITSGLGPTWTRPIGERGVCLIQVINIEFGGGQPDETTGKRSRRDS